MHGKVGSKNKEAVNALWASPVTNGEGKNGEVCHVLSGGKDGMIILWSCANNGIHRICDFSIFGCCGSRDSPPPVRAVCMSSSGKKIVVGTQTCEILEFVRRDGDVFSKPELQNLSEDQLMATSLVTGHFKNELWGLAVKPGTGNDGKMSDEYCTVGDDGFLRLWSVSGRRQMLCIDMKAMSRCCCYSPDGMMLAVGYGGSIGRMGKNKEDGMVRVYRLQRGKDSTPLSFLLMVEMKEAKR